MGGMSSMTRMDSSPGAVPSRGRARARDGARGVPPDRPGEGVPDGPARQRRHAGAVRERPQLSRVPRSGQGEPGPLPGDPPRKPGEPKPDEGRARGGWSLKGPWSYTPRPRGACSWNQAASDTAEVLPARERSTP